MKKTRREREGQGLRDLIRPRHVIMLLVLIGLVSAAAVFISSKGENEFDPRVDAWYKVEDWEVEVCSKWGGSDAPQSYSGSGVTGRSVITTAETVTVQGRMTEYDVKGNKTFIYEASWYYQPQTGSAAYSVYLVSGSGKEKIRDGSSTSQTGDGDYYANEYSADPGYTEVVIEYAGSSLSAPIQKKEAVKIG